MDCVLEKEILYYSFGLDRDQWMLGWPGILKRVEEAKWRVGKKRGSSEDNPTLEECVYTNGEGRNTTKDSKITIPNTATEDRCLPCGDKHGRCLRDFPEVW